MNKDEAEYDAYIRALRKPADNEFAKLKKLTEELSRDKDQEKEKIERERRQRERYEQEKREQERREYEKRQLEKQFWKPLPQAMPQEIPEKYTKNDDFLNRKQKNPWILVAVVALIVVLLSAGVITYGILKKEPPITSINNTCSPCQTCSTCPSCPAQTCTCTPVIQGSNISCHPATINIYNSS